MILEKINGPADIKKLNINELYVLADETRNAVINRLTNIGGHSGPNLGIVELTVALHFVFDSPEDKIVFDVSHQCYPHKILTGRSKAFLNNEHFRDVTGYTNPNESEHDIFTVGHTSTSVSLALGLAKGRNLSGKKGNVIAIIGDGSLSGGEALEAIDYAGEYNKNLIIIVNDNDQSIAENHGGLYGNLKELRDTNGESKNNIFRNFGLEYKYLDDGHNIEKLIELFRSVKGIEHPIVLHIKTIKGKGLPYAEKNREAFHAGGPFNIEDGSPKQTGKEDTTLYDSLINLLETDEKSVILNAATPSGLGFTKNRREKWAKNGRFIDVGIAEENAMAMASGIAKNGGTAVFGTFAAFLQRTYDQLSHDLCLNNSPATLLVLMPGVYGMNSNTHIAFSDIQLFSHVPNLTYLDPVSRAQYKKMFEFATKQKNGPVAIRYSGKFIDDGISNTADEFVAPNRSAVIKNGSEIAIIATASLMKKALQISEQIKEKLGIDITIIAPIFLNGLDEDLLKDLKKNHRMVITIEDGYTFGGYGQNVASFYGDSNMKVKNLGLSKEFHSDFNADALLEQCGISAESIIKLIKE